MRQKSTNDIMILKGFKKSIHVYFTITESCAILPRVFDVVVKPNDIDEREILFEISALVNCLPKTNMCEFCVFGIQSINARSERSGYMLGLSVSYRLYSIG